MVSFFYRHSATMLNDQLVIFGGWDAPICYNDLHILDMSKCCWCIWSNLKGRKLIKTWILSISVGDGCILHMHTIYYVCCKGLQHSSILQDFFIYLLLLGPVNNEKLLKMIIAVKMLSKNQICFPCCKLSLWILCQQNFSRELHY